MANYFAYTARVVREDRLLHCPIPDDLWSRISNFLESASALPCWVDSNLSTTVFGPKQNLDFWERVFATGVAPTGVRILAEPLDLNAMIRGRVETARKQ
jgi:hypothetical protein